MTSNQKVEEIMNLTFDRLDISRDPRKSNQKEAIQVLFIHRLLEDIVTAKLILDGEKIIEIIRAVTDALELILQENRKEE